MKFLIIVIFSFSIAFKVDAQNLKESDVPSVIKEKFSSLYPNVSNARWEMEHGKYEAEFKENKIETSVIFDANGTLTETEVEIPLSSLPAGVKDYAAKNFTGKNIKEASKITDSSGKITYEAEINGIDYIFDEYGNYLRSDSDSNSTEDDK